MYELHGAMHEKLTHQLVKFQYKTKVRAHSACGCRPAAHLCHHSHLLGPVPHPDQRDQCWPADRWLLLDPHTVRANRWAVACDSPTLSSKDYIETSLCIAIGLIKQ